MHDPWPCFILAAFETDEETGAARVPLYRTAVCDRNRALECHGDPAGEIDQYGYPKEGMKVGDIGGAMSITEPMSIYEEGIAISVTQQALMVLIMVACCGSAGIFLAANRLLLRPIESLSAGRRMILIAGRRFRL